LKPPAIDIKAFQAFFTYKRHIKLKLNAIDSQNSCLICNSTINERNYQILYFTISAKNILAQGA
jgi:hypothetical protein